MQVISKASFLFVRNPLSPGREEFMLGPTGADPKYVPDWAREDPTFVGAVKDGNLSEVVVKSSSKPAPKEKVPKEASGLK